MKIETDEQVAVGQTNGSGGVRILMPPNAVFTLPHRAV
jgi:hypothetical protein